jgi:hypothetical protein
MEKHRLAVDISGDNHSLAEVPTELALLDIKQQWELLSDENLWVRKERCHSSHYLPLPYLSHIEHKAQQFIGIGDLFDGPHGTNPYLKLRKVAK